MPPLSGITPDKLVRLVGTPRCPTLVDVRIDEDFAANPRLIPGSLRLSHAADEPHDWPPHRPGKRG